LLFKTRTDWHTANEVCQSLGGNLTAFGKQRDMDQYLSTWIQILVKLKKADKKDFEELWIGLTTKPGTGNFVDTNPDAWFWVGTGATPSNAWASNYPSIAYQQCGSLVVASMRWQNNNCGPDSTGLFAVARPFLCELAL
jgi:hypothetical protein